MSTTVLANNQIFSKQAILASMASKDEYLLSYLDANNSPALQNLFSSAVPTTGPSNQKNVKKKRTLNIESRIDYPNTAVGMMSSPSSSTIGGGLNSSVLNSPKER